METKFIERGKYKGNIDVPATLRTMRVTERWVIDPSLVNIGSVRNVCAKMKRERLSFTVHTPCYSEPNITVVRNRFTDR